MRKLGNCRRLLSRAVRSHCCGGRALGDLTRRLEFINPQLSETRGCDPVLLREAIEGLSLLERRQWSAKPKLAFPESPSEQGEEAATK